MSYIDMLIDTVIEEPFTYSVGDILILVFAIGISAIFYNIIVPGMAI